MTSRLLPALLSALLLAVPAVAQDPPAAKGPDEKTLLKDFDKAFKAREAPARAAAVTALGELSRQLADGGRSKALAKALAKALGDDDLEVQSAGVAQLAWGRDVETALPALGDHVEVVRKAVDQRITNPSEEAKAYVNRATRLFGDTCTALANYRDDRAVATLAAIIQRLQSVTEDNDTSTRLIGRIAEPLLALGTHDAVRACVRQTQEYAQMDGFQEAAAKELHRVLAIFATREGKAPPDYSQTYYVDWDNWFEKHADSFPKKLGKLKEPPPEPARVAPGREGEQPADGGPAAR